ncbi:hypothetical protein [Lactobacillus sp. PSON]|uniref:hypothetical protein n=1 Tax=Lactobacillus sp. PSON TaxID=3455454 RepID=UPI004042C201
MLIIVILNVIIGFGISYFCARELGFDLTLWTMSIDFLICGAALFICGIPIWQNYQNSSVLTFIASLLVLVGAVSLVISLIMKIPRNFNKKNRRELGIMLELIGIIALIVLWKKPFDWESFILPELFVLLGLGILWLNRVK